MPAGQQLSHQAPSSANGESTAHELFAMTDEQILEIEPEGEVNVAPPFRAASSPVGPPDVAENAGLKPGATQNSQDSQTASQQPPVISHDSPEPPPWLAAQMKDPWSGEEAKEFWNGVQQAQQEAAAYRAAFATPEDARALKELYPGGVNEARATVERARLLEQIDQAYFGLAGKSPEQTSAARTQLAVMMLREDPAAFREMVFTGLRALEEAEKGSNASTNASNLPRLAQLFAPNQLDAHPAVGATLASPAPNLDDVSTGGASPAPTAHVAAYASFEKAANEDLERSVGAAIARTIEQALPNLQRSNRGEQEGARHGVPLQDRLSAAVRQDVEAALKGDRQLGEQIAQILSARRFDNETRAQVVRLIDDRARQLVPSAARRVINDWTQATLAAHRGSAARADTASFRKEVAAVSGAPSALAQPSAGQGTSHARTDDSRRASAQHGGTPRFRGVDYRKLSDEQILEL